MQYDGQVARDSIALRHHRGQILNTVCDTVHAQARRGLRLSRSSERCTPLFAAAISVLPSSMALFP
jgi:hypothetical protein